MLSPSSILILRKSHRFVEHMSQNKNVNELNLMGETCTRQEESRILFKIPGEYNSFSSSPPRQHAIVKRVAEREGTEALD